MARRSRVERVSIERRSMLPAHHVSCRERHSVKNKTTDKQIQKLRQKLAENPKDTETLLALGKLYFLSSQFDKAVKSYRALLEQDARNASAYYNLAVAFLAQKETNEAKEALQRVLELDPNNEAAQKELAKLVSFP